MVGLLSLGFQGASWNAVFGRPVPGFTFCALNNHVRWNDGTKTSPVAGLIEASQKLFRSGYVYGAFFGIQVRLTAGELPGTVPGALRVGATPVAPPFRNPPFHSGSRRMLTPFTGMAV